MAQFLKKHFGVISYQQNNEHYIKLETFINVLKANRHDEDRIKFKRLNIVRNLKSYEESIIVNNEEYISLTTILRYVFNYSTALAYCNHLKRDVCLQLSNVPQTENINVPFERPEESPSSILQIYKLVIQLPFKALRYGDILSHVIFNEREIDTLYQVHKDNFTVEEWKKICIFEINFGNSVSSRDRNISKEVEKRLAFYNLCLQASKVGQEWASASNRAIILRRQRFHASDEDCEIQLLSKEVHILNKIDEDLTEHAQLYFPNVFKHVLVVPAHSVGFVHVYAQLNADDATDEARQMADFLARVVERRHNITCTCVIYFKRGVFAQFGLRDWVLSNKLNNSIAYRCVYNHTPDDDEMTKSETRCHNCFRGYVQSPLSIENFNLFTEWFLGVPLITQLLCEEFISSQALQDAKDQKEYLRPKLRKLYHCYDTMLNVATQKYTGLIQKLNTKELLMHSKNIHTVFKVTSNSGTTMSLDSAERYLDKCTEPELCRYNTFIKAYKMSYETKLGNVTKLISLKDDCIVILMLDNLVRLKYRSDPDPGECRSKQMNTLPITIQGIPRDTAMISRCHEEEICDGTDDCPCKIDTQLTDEHLNVFTDLLPEEELTLQCFQKLCTWGFNELWKILSENGLIPSSANIFLEERRPMTDSSAHEAPLSDIVDEGRHMTYCYGDETPLAEEVPLPGTSVDRRHVPASYANQTPLSGISLEGRHIIPSYTNDTTVSGTSVEGRQMTASCANETLMSGISVEGTHTTASYTNDTPRAGISVEGRHITASYANHTPLLSILMDDNDDANSTQVFDIEEESGEFQVAHVTEDTDLAAVISKAICCEINEEAKETEPQEPKIIFENEENISTVMPERFGLKKFILPAMLTRHPPPASGRDDDPQKLREILDDMILKLEYNQNGKEKILFGPDHKIGQNLLKLKQQTDQYSMFLAEFPLLHTRKHKITVLFSAYKDAGLLELLRFMKDDEEQDWSKLVTLHHIDIATRYIRRLSVSFHIAFLVCFIGQLTPQEAVVFWKSMKTETPEIISEKWHAKYAAFIEKGCKASATFCLHVDMMMHCD